MYSQFMNKVLHSAKGRSLLGKCYISRRYGNTHYDTLRLPTTCTAKEIREAFINLSKALHPDHNQNDPQTHAGFVRLNEAYQVLSRPESRRAYDLSLSRPPLEDDVNNSPQQEQVVWDQSFWEKRDKSQDRTRDHNSYYGIRGLRRVRSGYIALLLFVISAFGTALQLMALHSGLTFSREQLNERDRLASKALADLQAQTHNLNKQERFDIMKNQLGRDKFEGRTEILD